MLPSHTSSYRSNSDYTNNVNGASALRMAMEVVENLKKSALVDEGPFVDGNSAGDYNLFRRTGHPNGNEIEYNSTSTSNPFRKTSRLDYQYHGSNNTANGNGHS